MGTARCMVCILEISTLIGSVRRHHACQAVWKDQCGRISYGKGFPLNILAVMVSRDYRVAISQTSRGTTTSIQITVAICTLRLRSGVIGEAFRICHYAQVATHVSTSLPSTGSSDQCDQLQACAMRGDVA